MPNSNFDSLCEKIKKYSPNADFKKLLTAYEFSKKAHEGQQRISGEPYIIHPLHVAHILADIEMDITSIIAGILHDIVEDTSCTIEDIKQNFGDDVALLVDGVTKLSKIPYTTKKEQQMENLRKMFLAMAKDIRVIMIKLADRLHNMRTLRYMSEDKQVEKAKETMEIYAPLAHRLGISKIKWELEDLALRYLDPKGYYDLVDKISIKRKEREAVIKEIMDTLRTKTAEIGIQNASVDGRAKHFYSIYRKMKEQNKTIDQIYDLFAVRLIVSSVKDCYAVLGLVHELYKPIPGRFKDYIAMPKPNMYQSLHNTLIGPHGYPFEVQIRTWEMHRIAEVGIAAHWKYKEGSSNNDMDNKLVWLRQLLDWQNDMRDADEFMENLKIDLFTDEVFVFTPKGDVISLSAGSTPIDFAYNIHSAVGNKMMGAKVNGKIVNLDYELKNGDIVEVLTSSNVHGPSRDWLKIAKTSQARNKINQWLKKEKREENIIKGKDMVEKELKKQGFTYNQLFKPEWLEPILKKQTFTSLDDLYSSIGFGTITANKIISRLKEEFKKTLKPEELLNFFNENELAGRGERKKRKQPENGVIVKGIDNCLVRLSRCCNPLPGDDIVGYITRGRGVSVHRKDCTNVVNELQGADQRIIEVSWYQEGTASYNANITVMAHDRTALLMEITNTIGEAKIPLKAINARTSKDQIAIMSLTLEITDKEQLDKIIKKIRKIEGVFEITRSKQ